MLGVCRVSPAARRSFVMGVAFAVATVVATPSFAQDPAPEAQAAPQEPQKPVLTLDGDAAVISILIKPDRVADFEEVLAKLKESLQKSENATRRRQAAGWKIFKSPQMAQGSAVYVFVIDPDDHALLDADYEVVDLTPDQQVCVIHPAELAPGMRETWSPMLGDLEIVAPFPQLDRECVRGDEKFRFGEVGVVVDHWELCAALFRRGWTRDRESSVFGFSLRWASLDLNTQLQGDGRRRVDSLSLRQHFPGGSPSVESDVIQSEATAESIAILELFAPDALYL